MRYDSLCRLDHRHLLRAGAGAYHSRSPAALIGGNMELTFGKYKGLSIDDPEVPTTYLEWLHARNVETAEELKGELARREQAESENSTWAERLVRSGFRTLATEYKSDANIQREIAGARAVLEGVLRDYFDAHGPQERVIERQRAYAQRILNSPNADEEDIDWAKRILEHYKAPEPKVKKASRR
jgi:hypothetical protein